MPAKRDFDVVIAGAGPAGLAAARRAMECGVRVAMIDDNATRGGQIWRSLPVPLEWESTPELITGARIVAAPARHTLLLETFESEAEIGYGALILATGARERFLPFPGWTLPHAMGAGGLQALAKSGMPVKGKRIVVAGSGPLLLAVAKYLKDHGAKVALVAEQAGMAALTGFGLTLTLHPGKALQGAMLRIGLGATPYVPSCWPVAASPGSVTLRRENGKSWTEPCDYLACGFGLIPNTELAALLGCRIADGRVLVDDLQQTSVSGVYAAGEVTGIGGLDLSLAEGEIAGYAAGGKPAAAKGRFGARSAGRRFAGALERGFALRPELKAVVTDETIVCRCEDIAFGRVRAFTGWREAKLQTRCGMGPCQGRICGGAVEFLLGWTSESVRPPLFPARIGTLDQTSLS
jgi:NADPH-dependent 2,4-dienoyl-CoA reductase/sulfur reductase-like enzyme